MLRRPKYFHILRYTLLVLQLYVLFNTLWFMIISDGGDVTPVYIALISIHLLSLPFFLEIANRMVVVLSAICAWLMAVFYVYQGFYDVLHIIVGVIYIGGIGLLSYYRWRRKRQYERATV